MSSGSALFRGVTWTNERVDLLCILWGDGLSASRIAAQLGGGITGSAVHSKAHRMQLSARRVDERSPVRRSA